MPLTSTSEKFWSEKTDAKQYTEGHRLTRILGLGKKRVT